MTYYDEYMQEQKIKWKQLKYQVDYLIKQNEKNKKEDKNNGKGRNN